MVDLLVILQDSIRVIPNRSPRIQAAELTLAVATLPGEHRVEERIALKNIKLVIAQTILFVESHELP
jgi:hypothetical protein